MPKTYDLEHKEYVCRMIVEEEPKISEISRELNISRPTLKKWLNEYQAKRGWVEKHNQKKAQETPVYRTPTDYNKELKANMRLLSIEMNWLLFGAHGSMSRKGNPYDNACVESFFATPKKELIYRRDFETKAEVIHLISWYITCFYNEKRRHSNNNYLSPNEYELDELVSEEDLVESYLLIG